MELRSLIDLLQEEHADDWHVLPSGPAERMLTGFVDVAASDEPPALAALQPLYRATYAPDARLGLAWSMADVDWREERTPESPPWMPAEWNGVEKRYAVALLNGSAVWQVGLASVDWGAGISGYLPWPVPRYADDGGPGKGRTIIGWRTTSWEASFRAALDEDRRPRRVSVADGGSRGRNAS